VTARATIRPSPSQSVQPKSFEASAPMYVCSMITAASDTNGRMNRIIVCAGGWSLGLTMAGRAAVARPPKRVKRKRAQVSDLGLDRGRVCRVPSHGYALGTLVASPEALPATIRYTRSPSVFCVSLSPSFLRTTAARKARTVCGCQPGERVTVVMVAPLGRHSSASTRACFEFARPLGLTAAGRLRTNFGCRPASVITTHALFAPKVQRKLTNGVVGFAAGGSSSDRKRSRPIRAFSATPHDGQRPCRTLAEDPGRTQPRAAYARRRSSNASGLHGRNSARILGIRASFQRDNLRRHF